MLIDKFHNMEMMNNLFSLGSDIKMPIWDIVRYHVYVKYYYPEKNRILQKNKIKKKKLFYYIKHLLKFIFGFYRKKSPILFLTSSRFYNDQGVSFDKSAYPIIKEINKDQFSVLESLPIAQALYPFNYDFCNFYLRFFKKKHFCNEETYAIIRNSLQKSFGECLISKNEIEQLLNAFWRHYIYYKAIFKAKKVKKLFISTGNPKASILASKELKIETYLIQHAGIEKDEIDYSYPRNVKIDNFILFPDYLLTFGDYWGKNVNIPVKDIIVTGNSFFYNKPYEKTDNSILVISSIVHSTELVPLTQEFARIYKQEKIVYKLHPNEFHLFDYYVESFKLFSNISIVMGEIDTSILIARSKGVVLIVSAVIYEALNQNKTVCIYKRINYERQLHLADNPNVNFFDNIDELYQLINKPSIYVKTNFYNNTNKDIIHKITYLN